MPNYYEILAAGAPFRVPAGALRAELGLSLTTGAPFPLRRIFELFPLATENDAFAEKMEARGHATPIDAAHLVNSGRRINQAIYKVAPGLDLVRLHLPRDLKVRIEESDERLGISPVDTNVLMYVEGLPPQTGLGTDFFFQRLEIDDGRITWRFEERDRPDNGILLIFDLDATANDIPRPRLNLPIASPRVATGLSLIAKEALSSAACCPAPEPRPRRPPSSEDGPNIDLHLLILQEPSVPVDEQVSAAATLFAQHGFALRVSSRRVVHWPELLDIDARPGKPDFDHLTSRRDGIGPLGVAIYFVRSVVPPETQGLAWTGGYPVPGGLVARGAPLWTLAHEIGHILGLDHITDRKLLMNPTTAWIDLPPDLVPSNVKTMQGSPFTHK